MAKVRYTPDDRGLREIAQSAAMQAESVRAAGVVQRAANAEDPAGRYETRPATVTGGWQNEQRAGAIVEQAEYSRVGGRLRTLARASQEARD